jgi:hypothetical protein
MWPARIRSGYTLFRTCRHGIGVHNIRSVRLSSGPNQLTELRTDVCALLLLALVLAAGEVNPAMEAEQAQPSCRHSQDLVQADRSDETEARQQIFSMIILLILFVWLSMSIVIIATYSLLSAFKQFQGTTLSFCVSAFAPTATTCMLFHELYPIFGTILFITMFGVLSILGFLISIIVHFAIFVVSRSMSNYSETTRHASQ